MHSRTMPNRSSLKQLLAELLLVAMVGLVLGLFGPFGSFADPVGVRIGYWVVYCIAGYGIFRPLVMVGRWLGTALDVPASLGVAIAVIVAALPMTVLVAMMLNHASLDAVLVWPGLGLLYFQVCLIGLLITGLFTLLFRKQNAFAGEPAQVDSAVSQDDPGPHAKTGDSSRSRLSDRLSPGFGPPLALKSEDHYVRVIGAQKDELLLLRLRDAIDELDADLGQQVHRSWWVARDAVASIQREGRTATITLTNDQVIPVSRSAMTVLRRSGWL